MSAANGTQRDIGLDLTTGSWPFWPSRLSISF